jgi:hypothetical protein
VLGRLDEMTREIEGLGIGHGRRAPTRGEAAREGRERRRAQAVPGSGTPRRRRRQEQVGPRPRRSIARSAPSRLSSSSAAVHAARSRAPASNRAATSARDGWAARPAPKSRARISRSVAVAGGAEAVVGGVMSAANPFAAPGV